MWPVAAPLFVHMDSYKTGVAIVRINPYSAIERLLSIQDERRMGYKAHYQKIQNSTFRKHGSILQPH